MDSSNLLAYSDTNRFDSTIRSSDDEHEVSRIFLGSIYAFLSFGLFANLAVVLTVVQILLARNQGASPNSNQRTVFNNSAHILLYILALSVVDSLVLVNAGVVSTTIFFQKWIFHRSLCTVYYAIDSVNKTLSTFILTCLSLDRLLAVKYPQKRFKIRSMKGTVFVLILCITFAFFLLLPVYVQTDLIDVSINIDFQHQRRNGSSSKLLSTTSTQSSMTTPTCAFVGESDFALALAVFGFLLPLILMSGFYTSMLVSLKKRRRRLISNAGMERSSISVGPTSESNTVNFGLRRSGSTSTAPPMQSQRTSLDNRVKIVTTRTLLLVLFHFGCWTPYWLGSFYVMLFEAELENTGVIIMYVVHIGTYLNSAVNPILYALLNRDLRQRRRNTLRRRRTGRKRRRSAIVVVNSLGNEMENGKRV